LLFFHRTIEFERYALITHTQQQQKQQQQQQHNTTTTTTQPLFRVIVSVNEEIAVSSALKGQRSKASFLLRP
jgi:hypothetical protein